MHEQREYFGSILLGVSSQDMQAILSPESEGSTAITPDKNMRHTHSTLDVVCIWIDIPIHPISITLINPTTTHMCNCNVDTYVCTCVHTVHSEHDCVYGNVKVTGAQVIHKH